MQNDIKLERISTNTPKKQPDHAGDVIAMLVVVTLLIAIVAQSPNKNNTKPNDIVLDTTIISPKPAMDTAQIEHYATPFDSMVYNILNTKQYQ